MDFDLLLAHAIKKPKEFVYSHPEYRLSIWQKLRLKYFLFLRKKGYSVAAITKHKEFYGLDFFVNKKVLIPRPDTELMVAEAIESIKYQVLSSKDILLVDVGTGSGCIPIAILKNLPAPIPAYATDISDQALKVAKKNARKHKVNIKFLRGNLLEPILQNPSLCLSPYRGEMGEPGSGLLSVVPSPIRGGAGGGVIITANLPYLTEQQFQTEPSIQREPKNALVADKNGLALYEELLQQINKIIKILDINYSKQPISNIKYPIFIFLEIDPAQTEVISKIIKQYLPNANLEIKKDLTGRDRLVKIF